MNNLFKYVNVSDGISYISIENKYLSMDNFLQISQNQLSTRQDKSSKITNYNICTSSPTSLSSILDELLLSAQTACSHRRARQTCWHIQLHRVMQIKYSLL